MIIDIEAYIETSMFYISEGTFQTNLFEAHPQCYAPRIKTFCLASHFVVYMEVADWADP